MSEQEFIESIKAQLEVRLETIQNRHQAIQNDRRKVKGPLPADWSEQAVAMENNEVLDRLDSSTREEILMIEGALKRIHAGTYGTCKSCEDPIAPRRLEALPFTSVCISCAE